MTRFARATRSLPAHPDLDQLRRQAKELLEAFVAGEQAALAEVDAHYRNPSHDAFALHHAQLVLARAYGFDSWPKLKSHVDGLNAQAFISAARANDLARVESMLEQRPDLINVQWSYEDERRALHHAVAQHAPAMVRLLMRHGADARVGVHPHREATTARTMAIEREQPDILAIIDEAESRRAADGRLSPKGLPDGVRGVSVPTPSRLDAAVVQAVASGDLEWLRRRHVERPLVNAPSWDSGGLLTIAARHNQRDVLAFLLDCGFDPDERVRWGEGADAAYSQGFPLWHCAATGKRELAEMLLQRGADPNVHVDSSGSPVYAAYRHRQSAMVELLTQHGGSVTPDIAGLYRDSGAARAILDGSAAVSAVDLPPGQTAAEYLLEFALSGGASDIVPLALARVDWTRDDPRWFRMLVRGFDFSTEGASSGADRRSYLEGLQCVVARCNPNVVGGFRRTALHEVAATGEHVSRDERATLARMLLDAGARLDVRDELFESTPLGWACRWGAVEVVELLLDRGANSQEPEATAWARPAAWARKMNRPAVLAALRRYGVSEVK